MGSLLDNIKFNESEVKKAEEIYNELKLDPAQRGMVDSMADAMIRFIPISKNAIKGFTWQVMESWQQKNKKTMADLHTMPLEARINATKDMITHSNKIYTRIMWKATPEQRKALEKGFDLLLEQSIKVMKGEKPL